MVISSAQFTAALLVALVMLGGCAPRITDDAIEEQVLEKLSKFEVGIGEPLSEIMVPEKVKVIDKKVEGKRCVAICVVSMRVKESYAASSIVATSLQLSGLPSGGGEQGEVKEADMSFVFELFESGWRLTD